MKNLFLKLLFLFKFLLNQRIIFSNPKHYDLVVFDDSSYNELLNIVNQYNHFLLKVRPESISEIYISFRILYNFIINFKGSIVTSYIISLLKVIKPKIVITFIDRSFKFSDVARLLHKEIKFFAIQNGIAYGDIKKFSYLKKKKITNYDLSNKLFIPNFFCLGKFDQDLYKKYNIYVNNYYFVGGVRLSNYLMHKSNKTFSNYRKRVDICFILDGDQSINIDRQNIGNFIKNLQYYINFSINRKFRVIFVLKRFEGILSQNEVNFYKNNLTQKEFIFLMSNSVVRTQKTFFSSYQICDSSKVVVGFTSTLLLEFLALNKKILNLNLTSTNIYDFPVKGICTLKNVQFKEFDKRLIEIYYMNKKEYFSKICKNISYYYNFDKNFSTINKIQNIIDKHLIN